MNENPAASDWAAARGEKWRNQLAEMEKMMAPIDEPLITALHLDLPYRIADIGCGGGGTSLHILRRAPAGSLVHGFDISQALVDSARARTSFDDRSIAFTLANVATAPAPNVPFQRLVSRFGIMFYDDPPAAFANLNGWLARGGRFAFAAWGPLSDNPWMTSVREVAAEIVEVPPVDFETPGPFRYGHADKLLALLNQAGFAELNVSDWRGTLSVGGGMSASEAAHFALASFSGFSEQLAESGEGALEEARLRLTKRFAQYERDGIVRIGACVHIFTGVRGVNGSR